MRRYEKLLEKAIIAADLPGEPTPGQPLVEISGGCRVFIENHCGVTMYGRNEIHIRVTFGIISVCGSGLELVYMSKQKLVISGKIDGISIRRTVR